MRIRRVLLTRLDSTGWPWNKGLSDILCQVDWKLTNEGGLNDVSYRNLVRNCRRNGKTEV